MTILNRTLLALALLGTLALSACDGGDPDDPEPGPENASVTLTVDSMRSAGDCDSATNPGDFQLNVAVLDAGNNAVTDVTLPTQTTYGVWAGTNPADFITLNAGQTATFGETISFQRPLTAAGGFTVVASVIEWDAANEADPDMNDVSASQGHPFSGGVFQNVVGTQSIRVRGSSACDVTVSYTLSVQ